MNILFRPLIIFWLISSSAYAGDEFKLMHSESIGPFKIGLERKIALKHLQGQLKSGVIEKWETDGRFHQKVKSPAEGISLGFVSDSKTGLQRIDEITITPPCKFATAAGIHIGSTDSEVIQVYRSDYNKEDGQPGAWLVVGSIYGGLNFRIKDSKVIQIFLGASAD